ncbi:hypothetical protein [Andreprevotia sp. IGB-42]|uniref:hypothetical protein n=1 Tax=Andreprevotia sp. IGB-42 TaxID=2497473 RepID=UPI00135A61F8|nr:hypothetical protein [Andreprevotia sp. IGB-42]
MDKDNDIKVARLDGYLNGISELSGRIREYASFAYAFSVLDASKSVADLLVEYYSPQVRLEFSSVIELAGNLDDLEAELWGCLSVDTLGELGGLFKELLVERNKYLAFRVMDQVCDIADSIGGCRKVFKLERKGVDETDCTYFGLLFDGSILFLQFNKMSYD